ncbi:MAG: glycosyltransferase family 39 protein [bacterium]|nr:glycosyltransferase family 39 protein [bacterium]
MPSRLLNIIAGFLLAIMFFTALSTIPKESFTFDETAHVAAGYSYLTQRDYRLNPEHPPLVKDLAALPLLFQNLNFPKQDPSWVQKEPIRWWFQFDFANKFLYHSGNNPDKILFFAKLPMLFILIFLGWFLFWWTKKEFGPKTAIFSLLLFTFSPEFIAHGKLITTDVAASLGVVLTTYFWLKFLRKPNAKSIISAGLIFGLAMLLKFSLVLLVPFLGIITIIYALLKKENVFKYAGFAILAGLIGFIFIVYPVYQFHISNYPIEKQISDTVATLENSPMGPLKELDIFMAKTPILRPFGQYLLGLLMATQRTASGNTVYFLGMIKAGGWWYYFPVLYLLKVPLAFHILTLISLILTLSFSRRDKSLLHPPSFRQQKAKVEKRAKFSLTSLHSGIRKPFWVNFDTLAKRAKEWITNQFTVFAMMVFLLIYWITSISGNLNIGIRHILPTFPFTYILVSLGIVYSFEQIKKPALKKAGALFIGFLMAFYVASSIKAYPFYLSYFNELAGGEENGYKVAVDSNYDWGQDLKRLAKWIKENNIEKIKIDYFGGGDLPYYLGEKAENFDRFSGPQKGWLAISITQLQGGKAKPVEGFDGPAGYYSWLDKYTPVAKIGYSIFIYYIK